MFTLGGDDDDDDDNETPEPDSMIQTIKYAMMLAGNVTIGAMDDGMNTARVLSEEGRRYFVEIVEVDFSSADAVKKLWLCILLNPGHHCSMIWERIPSESPM